MSLLDDLSQIQNLLLVALYEVLEVKQSCFGLSQLHLGVRVLHMDFVSFLIELFCQLLANRAQLLGLEHNLLLQNLNYLLHIFLIFFVDRRHVNLLCLHSISGDRQSLTSVVPHGLCVDCPVHRVSAAHQTTRFAFDHISHSLFEFANQLFLAAPLALFSRLLLPSLI